MKMKTLIMLLAAAVAIISLSASSKARHDTGDSKTPTSKKHDRRKEPTTRKKYRLRGMHARMVTVCGLNDEQQSQIVDLNDRRREAAKRFRSENAEKLQTLKAELAKARENKDKEATKDTYAKIRALRQASKDLDKQWQKRIMFVLTPEQKVKWDQDKTMRSVMRRFKNVKFTDDQKAKIKTACATFTKGVDLSDKKARYEAIKELAEHIRKEILTDAQRAATTTRPSGKSTTRPGDS